MGKGIEPLGAVKVGFKILASRVASGEASAASRWLQVFSFEAKVDHWSEAAHEATLKPHFEANFDCPY